MNLPEGTTMNDEIMRELRKVKDDIARECGYDIERLVAKWRKLQDSLPPERIVNLQNQKRSELKAFTYPVPSVTTPLAAHEGSSSNP
jgi:hypothetical protein